MEYLPDLVIETIFKFVSNYELLNLRLVCEKWNRIICQGHLWKNRKISVKMSYTFIKKFSYFVKNVPLFRILRIDPQKIEKPFFDKVHTDILGETLEQLKSLHCLTINFHFRSFNWPKTLTHLRIDTGSSACRSINDFHLNSLVECCSHLEYLFIIQFMPVVKYTNQGINAVLTKFKSTLKQFYAVINCEENFNLETVKKLEQCTKLEQLGVCLTSGDACDAVLASLNGFKHLDSLMVFGYLDNENFMKFVGCDNKVESIKRLQLGYMTEMTENEFELVQLTFPNIQELYLTNCSFYGDDFVSYISSSKFLTNIFIDSIGPLSLDLCEEMQQELDNIKATRKGFLACLQKFEIGFPCKCFSDKAF